MDCVFSEVYGCGCRTGRGKYGCMVGYASVDGSHGEVRRVQVSNHVIDHDFYKITVMYDLSYF